jgi:hypothetical protein
MGDCLTSNFPQTSMCSYEILCNVSYPRLREIASAFSLLIPFFFIQKYLSV